MAREGADAQHVDDVNDGTGGNLAAVTAAKGGRQEPDADLHSLERQWLQAEHALYPMIFAQPDAYEMSVRLVRAVADGLRDATAAGLDPCVAWSPRPDAERRAWHRHLPLMMSTPDSSSVPDSASAFASCRPNPGRWPRKAGYRRRGGPGTRERRSTKPRVTLKSDDPAPREAATAPLARSSEVGILTSLTMSEIAQAVRDGALSASDVVSEALDSLDLWQPLTNAAARSGPRKR